MQSLARLLLASCALFCGAALAADGPLLWEVQGAKSKHYLMGSVHLLPDSAYPMPAALDGAYDAAETLVFESDLAALNDPQTQMKLLASGQAAAGLKALIGPEMDARVHDYAKSKGIPPEICDHFKPWYCALTLEILSFVQAGFKPELSVDLHYYARAKSAQKTILWLEDPGPHLKLFSEMSEADARQLLGGMLEDENSSGANPQQLLQAWQSGDAAALEKITADFKREAPQLYERLLAARNRAWLPRLERMFGEKGSTLVIVGAAHMVGPDGLITQLRARGYAVNPVAMPPPDEPPAAATIPLGAAPAQ